MTTTKLDEFYKKNKKKYELGRNKDFLNWLKNSVQDGYYCYMEVSELQDLIDTIVRWYEIKYPERDFLSIEDLREEQKKFKSLSNLMVSTEGFHHDKFKGIKSLSDAMGTKELLYTLSYNELSLMECDYRAKGYSQGSKSRIFMRIVQKKDDSYFLLYANPATGKIEVDENNNVISDYLDGEININLDELLVILRSKYADELGLQELEECVYNHNSDVELRYRILSLVALKLLYSRNTIPERGYIRAKRFIDDFNEDLGLDLPMVEIDQLMKECFSKEEEKPEPTVSKKYAELVKSLFTSGKRD